MFTVNTDDLALGKQAFQQKQLDDAIIHFTNAAEKPNYPPQYRCNGFNNRGFILKSLRKYEEAKQDFDRAIEINPNNDGPYINRGLLLQDQYKKYDDALNDYNHAIHINPSNYSAYNNRGNLYMNHFKYYDLALQDYNKALQLNPKSIQTYAQRGYLVATAPVYRDQYAKLIQALKDFDEALALDPNSGANYGWKSFVLLKLDRLEEAHNLADVAIQKNPKSGIAYFVKAQVLAKGKSQPDWEVIQWFREFVVRGCPIREFTQQAKNILRQWDPEWKEDPAKMKLTDVVRLDSQWREICLILNNAGKGNTWRDLGDYFKIPSIELDDVKRTSKNPAKELLTLLNEKLTLQDIITALETINFEAALKLEEYMRPGSADSNAN